MIKKSPAFQFYPSDYLSSLRVSVLTLQEQGAYIRLLCYCWVHGSIPSDPIEMSYLLGREGTPALAASVAHLFTQDPNNEDRLIHDRLEVERAKQTIWRENKSKAGKASALVRKNTQTVSTPVQQEGQQTPQQNPTLQPSVFSLHNNNTPIPPSGGEAGVAEKKTENPPQAPDAPDAPDVPDTPDAPYAEIIAAYNRLCRSLPKATGTTDSRKKALRSRWLEHQDEGLAWFEALFARVERSDFLAGRSDRFRASFDWVIKASNCTKIMEGNYDNRALPSPNTPPPQPTRLPENLRSTIESIHFPQ